MIALPHVNIYLNKDENKRLLELCKEEDCSRYALAKGLVLEAMKSYKEKNNVGKQAELESGHKEDSKRDTERTTEKLEAAENRDKHPPFIPA